MSLKKLFKRAAAHVIQPTCGNCGAAIAIDDVDLPSQTGKCRACGHVSWLKRPDNSDDPVDAQLSNWTPDRAPPPVPPAMLKQVQETGDTLSFQRRTGSIGAGIFIAAWLIAWTVGCFFLTQHIIHEKTAFSILFAVPFYVGWFFAFAVMIHSFFGREKLSIDRDEAHYRKQALITLSNRALPLSDISGIRSRLHKTDSETNQRTYGLELQTTSKPIRFGNGLDEDQRLWLAWRIRQHLHKVGSAVSKLPSTTSADASVDVKHKSLTETLQPVYPSPAEPSENDLVMKKEFNLTAFRRRFTAESFKNWLGVFIVVSGIMLIWNGILSVFIVQLFSGFQWFLFLFLIPFELIGLVMLLVWFLTLLPPLLGQLYEFRPDEASVRETLLGIGRTKNFSLRSLQRLELRHVDRTRAWKRPSQTEDSDTTITLAFIGNADEELFGMKGLTEAQARWIAGELFTDFKQWMMPVARNLSGSRTESAADR